MEETIGELCQLPKEEILAKTGILKLLILIWILLPIDQEQESASTTTAAILIMMLSLGVTLLIQTLSKFLQRFKKLCSLFTYLPLGGNTVTLVLGVPILKQILGSILIPEWILMGIVIQVSSHFPKFPF